ncbi:hypothetical protein GN244_ATG07625 [Phytophthora infestans]|uniref:Uncharacterized protein n=1 Tax=Phytophthora infestans TaxID=4787 RepID=A0A833TFX3_PHYIN|nr:hypothetical protein GN244_ATG07625 [Phytophthora infestans]
MNKKEQSWPVESQLEKGSSIRRRHEVQAGNALRLPPLIATLATKLRPALKENAGHENAVKEHTSTPVRAAKRMSTNCAVKAVGLQPERTLTKVESASARKDSLKSHEKRSDLLDITTKTFGK